MPRVANPAKPKVSAKQKLARKIPAMRTKKPKTAFNIFRKKIREEVVEKNKDLKPKDINANISEMWKGMTEEEKAAYAPKKREGPKKKAEKKEE